ncbi:MAG: hypothetical protein KGJ02_02525 [Verrucomicrobiota bacterium]|nr:hypothetical protein [Verrucomicrobiota bacterium]
MFDGMNPWVAVWTRPRQVVRAVVRADPTFGFWSLSFLFGLSVLFYLANFYSWGLSFSFVEVLWPILIGAPFFGALYFLFKSWILQFIGRLLGGKAPYSHVRAAFTWSRSPYALALLLWIALFSSESGGVFVHYDTDTSAVFINLIIAILVIWSAILLIQTNAEIQSFSLFRSLLNVFLSWLLSSFIIVILMFVTRYIVTRLI